MVLDTQVFECLAVLSLFSQNIIFGRNHGYFFQNVNDFGTILYFTSLASVLKNVI